MSNVEVTLKLDHISLVVEKAKIKSLAALALATAGQAQMNIRGNDQIDTGFMVNSVYAVTEAGQEGDTWGSGKYEDSAGRQVARNAAPPALLDGAEAAVVVGANYAIHQELQKPFLYPAGEAIAKVAGGICRKVFQEVMHD